MEARVARIMDEERIAAEVASRLKTRRNELFSWPVKVGAMIAAVSATASFAFKLIQVAGG